MKKIVCVFLLLVLVLLAACSPETELPSENYAVLITRKPAKAQNIDLDTYPSVVDGVKNVLVPYSAEFVAQFLKKEAGGGKNTLCSPLTAYFALSLLAEASRGKTQQEILSALHVQDIDALRTFANLFYEN